MAASSPLRWANHPRDDQHAAGRRLASVLDGLPSGVCVVSPDGRISACNQAARQMLGRDMSGRLVLGLDIGAQDTDGRPLSGADMPTEITRRTGVPQRGREIGIPGPDGQIRWLSMDTAPLLDEPHPPYAVVACFSDVTESRGLRERLRQSEQQFRATFEGAPIGLGVVTLDGRILQANGAWADIVGHPRDVLESMHVTDIVHPDDRADSVAEVERLLTGQATSVRAEKRYLHAEGHAVWVQMDVSLVRDDHGRPRHLIAQIQDISARRSYEDRLVHLADHDGLTGLLNRRGFRREVDRHLAHSRRYGAAGALLMLDLDHFKYVNDTLGHSAGDELIVHAADLLRSRLRESDIVGRLGGDEFAVLIPAGDRTDAERVAELVLASMRDAAAHRRGTTASIGIATIDDSTRSSDELLVNADLAMYDAKEAGRDGFACFQDDAHHQPRIKSRMSWVERIRAALLDPDGFVLHAQPIVALDDRQPAMHEVLLRMRDDDGSLVYPGTFLYIAERVGLVADLDRHVLRESIRTLGRAQAAGRQLSLTVNVSGRSLGDPEVLTVLRDALAASGADPSSLVIEITETAAAEHLHQARAFAQSVRQLGCLLALDDFGSGFGSFQYLKHLPFDLLKVDGEFVATAPDDPANALIVDTVARLAHGFGGKVVAEHCVDERVLQFLKDAGVDYAQGYFVGRPVPLADVVGSG